MLEAAVALIGRTVLRRINDEGWVRPLQAHVHACTVNHALCSSRTCSSRRCGGSEIVVVAQVVTVALVVVAAAIVVVATAM